MYSVLSRNRSRKSLDKPGAPSDHYGSKASFHSSKDKKVLKSISDKPHEESDSAKPSNALKDADSGSKRSINKINNEEKGKGNDKDDSHSVISFHSLKDKPQDKNKSSNSLNSDEDNIDDLYDELDEAFTLNKQPKVLKQSKEDFDKLHDDLKYDEKEFDTLYKVVESYEKIDTKKSSRSRDNDNKSVKSAHIADDDKASVKSHEESEKDDDSLKSSYTLKRKSFTSKKSDTLKRNDKPMEINQAFRRSEQNILHPDEFRRDRNYKDSNDKARNNRKDYNREDDYRRDNNKRDDRRRDDRRRDDRRRDDRRRNRSRRRDIDDDYDISIENLKRKKKSILQKVLPFIGDEDEPSKLRMFNKKGLLLKIVKLIKKIDFMFEVEIMNSMKRSLMSDAFLIKPETELNKTFYYIKKYKVLTPILITLVCLVAFYAAGLPNVAFGTVFVLLAMIVYYNMKLTKCRKMGKLFRCFSESNKFEIR
ncbi:hypothetical protein PVIIG_04685 [Plasmodium vivax India VII]|nr:hypothetical protein PVIIG_04685 [Plasmodium vivax India VII]